MRGEALRAGFEPALVRFRGAGRERLEAARPGAAFRGGRRLAGAGFPAAFEGPALRPARGAAPGASSAGALPVLHQTANCSADRNMAA